MKIRFKDIPVEERPRERLIMYGANNLSNEELLMIILKTGTKNYSVKEVVINLLNSSNGIIGLKNMTLNSLSNIPGIGQVKAIELMAMIELSKRMNENISIKEMINCTNPSTIINYFNYLFKDRKSVV